MAEAGLVLHKLQRLKEQVAPTMLLACANVGNLLPARGTGAAPRDRRPAGHSAPAGSHRLVKYRPAGEASRVRHAGPSRWAVDIVLEVDVERDVHDGAFETRPIAVGSVHHDQDVDVRIRTSISTSDRPEQAHIRKQRTEGGAELPCELADGVLPTVLE